MTNVRPLPLATKLGFRKWRIVTYVLLPLSLLYFRERGFRQVVTHRSAVGSRQTTPRPSTFDQKHLAPLVTDTCHPI
jgi:hypothetical protein